MNGDKSSDFYTKMSDIENFLILVKEFLNLR